MVEQIVTRLEDFTLQYREIDDKPLFVELSRMKANLKLPSVSVDIDTVSLVPTDMVGKVDVNAFIYSKHVQNRLVAVDLKKQPENRVKRNSSVLIGRQRIKISHMDQQRADIVVA